MGTETLAIGSGRMFRYALGSLLLLAGMSLLVAQGLARIRAEGGLVFDYRINGDELTLVVESPVPKPPPLGASDGMLPTDDEALRGHGTGR